MSSHAFKELVKVLAFGSGMLEAHPKIKSKPFRGSHRAQFVVRPPGPRPPAGAELLVSYRFTVRTPCAVVVGPLRSDRGAVLVTIDLQERGEGREFQRPDLPASHEETYSTDELNLLSPGAGDKLALGELLIEVLAGIFTFNPLYVAYIRYIFGLGLKGDIFEPLPDIDVLDPSGGVSGVPVQQIVPGSGVVTDNNQDYPITGWLEASWATPIG